MVAVVYAQQDPVLIKVNGYDVTRSEFEYIYNKNSSLSTLELKGLDEYVELFINFKLKVDAARKAGIDTTKAFREELAGYRKQLAKSYLSDDSAKEEEALAYYNKLKKRAETGNLQITHIFKSMPQNVSALKQRAIDVQLDSIYNALIANPRNDFSDFVNRFSDDKGEYWIGFLQTPKEFEDVVFSMKIGEVSKPFYTPQGKHIVKVLNKTDLPPFAEMKGEIMKRLSKRSGVDKGAEAMVEKLKKEYGFVFNTDAIAELKKNGETNRVLFYINNCPYDGKLFKRFADGYPRSMQLQLNAFVAKSILDYENNLLEKKYPEFKLLMQEYKEGMMFFEISNREIWDNSSIDEKDLEKYFVQHQSKYHWAKPKFDGVVVHAKDKKTAKQVKKLLKKMPQTAWKDTLALIVNGSNDERVKIEKGVFTNGVNPFVDHFEFKGKTPAPLVSFPYNFVYGRKKYGPSSYLEIRGIVASDYQNYLEELWMKRLRAEAVIEINRDVLKTVNNH